MGIAQVTVCTRGWFSAIAQFGGRSIFSFMSHVPIVLNGRRECHRKLTIEYRRRTRIRKQDISYQWTVVRQGVSPGRGKLKDGRSKKMVKKPQAGNVDWS